MYFWGELLNLFRHSSKGNLREKIGFFLCLALLSFFISCFYFTSFLLNDLIKGKMNLLSWLLNYKCWYLFKWSQPLRWDSGLELRPNAALRTELQSAFRSWEHTTWGVNIWIQKKEAVISNASQYIAVEGFYFPIL